jgi:hypothetical protein
MTELDDKKINELLDDKNFTQGLAQTKSTKDIIALLGKYYIIASEDEINKAKALYSESSELNEDALEGVSGGVNWMFIRRLVYILGPLWR